MNLANSEIISLLGVGITFVTVGGGAIYIRGIKDQGQAAILQRLEFIEGRFEESDGEAIREAEARGAQSERNKMVDAMVKDVRDIREKIVGLDSKLSSHEAECVRRQSAIEDRFTRVDRDISHCEAQIRNVAFGVHDRTVEIGGRV